MSEETVDQCIRRVIRNVPDFPQKGINFKDISPLIKDPIALRKVTDALVEYYKDKNISAVVGVEARGFIFGPLIALGLGCGFIMARKANKLPGDKVEIRYGKEYNPVEGQADNRDCLQIHTDCVKAGERVVVVDDLLATGGTAEAACLLMEKIGAVVASTAFIIELANLPKGDGRKRLTDHGWDVCSLAVYDAKNE